MRPKLLLLDEPCKKAKDILFEVFEEPLWGDFVDAYWTGLSPIETSKPVFCPCTGIDHVKAKEVIYLDEEWKRGEGTKVTSTAEHTWSLILQLAKMKRMQLSGKTLGIIGYGRIGGQVGKYAKAFDMEIKIADNYRDAGGSKRMIYLNADIITLHVPLNESTRGMIGEREFELMKDGALLVNTSRAKVISEDALIDALNSGKLGGYADDFYMDHLVDVTEHPNVILSNHISGNCIEAREATDIYVATKAVEYWRSRTHEN
jgi:phosphoglycerate dehydrogenase-like enzyme